jgi:hypothetical protein
MLKRQADEILRNGGFELVDSIGGPMPPGFETPSFRCEAASQYVLR